MSTIKWCVADNKWSAKNGKQNGQENRKKELIKNMDGNSNSLEENRKKDTEKIIQKSKKLKLKQVEDLKKQTKI